MSSLASPRQLPDLVKCGIDTYLERRSRLGMSELSVLYIDIIGFTRFAETYGPEACHGVLGVFSDVLAKALVDDSFPWPHVEAFQIWDDGFAVVIPRIIENGLRSALIHGLITALEGALNQRITTFGFSYLRLRYGLANSADADAGSVANASTRPSASPGASPDTSLSALPAASPGASTAASSSAAPAPLAERLYDLITEAGRLARRHPAPPPLAIVEAMGHIMETKEVRMHYQPIVHLPSAVPIGWECLARGPLGSPLENPLPLFHYADQMGCLLDVELICRNAAIRSARVDVDRKLFINISPNILTDPSFRAGETRAVIDAVGLRPDQIVFEITEHQAIREHARFLRLIDHYRQQGYQIAIDDVGAGHSGLVTLVQVKPDFIKIDMELVRGIETDATKQDIVRAIQQISSGFNGKVVAEGIETAEELACLRDCGIEYGQGYLLGRPSPQLDALLI